MTDKLLWWLIGLVTKYQNLLFPSHNKSRGRQKTLSPSTAYVRLRDFSIKSFKSRNLIWGWVNNTIFYCSKSDRISGSFSPFFPFPSAGNCMNGKELIRDDRNHLLCSRSNKLFPTFQNFYFLKIYSEKENYAEKKQSILVILSNFEC